jgi:hypothetical protein
MLERIVRQRDNLIALAQKHIDLFSTNTHSVLVDAANTLDEVSQNSDELQEKSHAFELITLNASNDKFSDSEFRDFVKRSFDHIKQSNKT